MGCDIPEDFQKFVQPVVGHCCGVWLAKSRGSAHSVGSWSFRRRTPQVLKLITHRPILHEFDEHTFKFCPRVKFPTPATCPKLASNSMFTTRLRFVHSTNMKVPTKVYIPNREATLQEFNQCSGYSKSSDMEKLLTSHVTFGSIAVRQGLTNFDSGEKAST